MRRRMLMAKKPIFNITITVSADKNETIRIYKSSTGALIKTVSLSGTSVTVTLSIIGQNYDTYRFYSVGGNYNVTKTVYNGTSVDVTVPFDTTQTFTVTSSKYTTYVSSDWVSKAKYKGYNYIQIICKNDDSYSSNITGIKHKYNGTEYNICPDTYFTVGYVYLPYMSDNELTVQAYYFSSSNTKLIFNAVTRSYAPANTPDNRPSEVEQVYHTTSTFTKGTERSLYANASTYLPYAYANYSIIRKALYLSNNTYALMNNYYEEPSGGSYSSYDDTYDDKYYLFYAQRSDIGIISLEGESVNIKYKAGISSSTGSNDYDWGYLTRFQ